MEELRVVFAIRETGQRVDKVFDSAYRCRLFINKLRRSKKLKLISYPNILM